MLPSHCGLNSLNEKHGQHASVTVKTPYTDTLYNSKILYNVCSICTNLPV